MREEVEGISCVTKSRATIMRNVMEHKRIEHFLPAPQQVPFTCNSLFFSQIVTN